MDNDSIHGDEHIKLIEGMTKYQLFAVNHYLARCNDELSFEEVLAAAQADDYTQMMPNEAYHHLTLEEIADDIYQMASDLEDEFK